MTRKIFNWIVLGAFLLTLSACGSSNKKHQSVYVKGTGGLRVTALIHAKGADFDFTSMGADSGTLTLRYVSPMVVYLSDSGEKSLETVPIAEFVSTWKEGNFAFPDELTNAGFFAFEDVEHELADYSFTLNTPRYNKSTSVLTFEIEEWKAKENKKLKHLDDVTIYIDGVWKKPIKGVSR